MARGGKPCVNPPRRVYRPLGGLLLKTRTGYLMAPEVLAAMVRKQLNLSLTLEQYKWLEELAQEAGETPTKYARHIVLDAISPAPETDLNSGVLVLPFWLAHFLLFLVLRGRQVRQLRHRGPSEPLPCLEAPGARTRGVRLPPGGRDPPVEGDGQPQTGGPR